MEFTEEFYKAFLPEEQEPMKRNFIASKELADFQEIWEKNLNDFETRFDKVTKRLDELASVEAKFPGTTSIDALVKKIDDIEKVMTPFMNKYSRFMDSFHEQSLCADTWLEMLKSGKRDEKSLEFMKTLAADGEKLLEQTDEYITAFKQLFRQLEEAESEMKKDFN